MLDRIYPIKLQLNIANSSDTEAPLLDLNLCISNGIVSTKIYDKRDDFDFYIVSFLFLDGDVPGVPHMGYTYLNLLDSPELLQILMTLTTVIKPLLPNFLGRAIVILNYVFEFYRRHSALLEKYSVSLKETSATRYIGTRIFGYLVYIFKIIVTR